MKPGSLHLSPPTILTVTKYCCNHIPLKISVLQRNKTTNITKGVTYLSSASRLDQAVVTVQVPVAPMIRLRLLAPGACGYHGAGVSAANGVCLPVDEPATSEKRVKNVGRDRIVHQLVEYSYRLEASSVLCTPKTTNDPIVSYIGEGGSAKFLSSDSRHRDEDNTSRLKKWTRVERQAYWSEKVKTAEV